MAISIDWGTKVITVPQADLTFVGGSLYDFDTDQFRKDLKALEAGEDGMAFLDTHEHTAPKTLSGITFARFVEIINGYTVTFQDGQYRVRFVGSNNNISDVANLNQVSLLPQNSAGLIVTASGAADWTAAEREQIRDALGVVGTKTPATGGQLQSLVNDVFARAIEAGMPLSDILKFISALLFGYVTGGPGSPVFSAAGQAGVPRVSFVADQNGNRITVTFTP